jgi:hypothetical protein
MGVRVLLVHHRPLALVSVLAGADYLLWNWSLQGSHDVLALISGLTLPPLALALIWLLGLNVARGLTQMARSPRRRPLAARLSAEEAQSIEQSAQQRHTAHHQPHQQREQHPGGAQHKQPPPSSSKLAA